MNRNMSQLKKILSYELDNCLYFTCGIASLYACLPLFNYMFEFFYLTEAEKDFTRVTLTVLAFATMLWCLTCAMGMMFWLRDFRIVKVPKSNKEQSAGTDGNLNE